MTVYNNSNLQSMYLYLKEIISKIEWAAAFLFQTTKKFYLSAPGFSIMNFTLWDQIYKLNFSINEHKNYILILMTARHVNRCIFINNFQTILYINILKTTRHTMCRRKIIYLKPSFFSEWILFWYMKQKCRYIFSSYRKKKGMLKFSG